MHVSYIDGSLGILEANKNTVGVSWICFETTGLEFRRDSIKFRERNGFSLDGL